MEDKRANVVDGMKEKFWPTSAGSDPMLQQRTPNVNPKENNQDKSSDPPRSSNARSAVLVPERSVAMKQGFTPSDPTLLCGPVNEAGKRFQDEVLQYVSSKFAKQRNQLVMFSVNQAVWGTFKNSCMRSVLHLSKDDERLRRISENSKVRRAQTIIDTIHAEMTNLVFRDLQNFGVFLLRNW